MAKKQFFRYFPKKGFSLYWILLLYLVAGYFYPVIGFLAVICMIAPVAFAIRKGRWWCGNACPRGDFYDRVLAKYSPHKPIPAFVRMKGFRIFMVVFIFTMFGIQMYFAWGDWGNMGRVFWMIILVTAIVGVILSFVYAPRTWCSFCPMGTLSSWVTPRSGKLPDNYCRIVVGDRCTTKCKLCSAVCPMQLKPYESKHIEEGFLHPDCIKCGRCVDGCPLNVLKMEPNAQG
ncbi:MAG: 4Fe-4S binding protein [Prevotellaceae bacterium]|nr:4Fe-4S binding protein [Prevotellaceae bacterium]